MPHTEKRRDAWWTYSNPTTNRVPKFNEEKMLMQCTQRFHRNDDENYVARTGLGQNVINPEWIE